VWQEPTIIGRTEANLCFPQKIFPRTTQSALKADNSCQKNIYFPSFDFLNGSGMQRDHFGKPLLRDFLTNTLSAHIVAE
jgi:hypothetical protein